MTKYALQQKRVRARRRYVEGIKALMKEQLPEGAKIEIMRPTRSGNVRCIKYVAKLPVVIHKVSITGSIE